MDRFVVISGCSGGGKSTLIAELARRGHPVSEEAGRRIVREEMASGGSALPWTDMAAFARRAIALALADRERAMMAQDATFFDRSVVDVAAALERATGEPVLAELGQRYRYAPTVFMAPPWPDLFASDSQRQHDFAAAEAEYGRLCKAYAGLGYAVRTIPECPVAERADWLESQIATNPPCPDSP